MPALSITASLLGLDAIEVRVEAEIVGSLRKFTIVGLPDSALRESRERVRCAIENSGFSFPRREVIVSLSPAALPKSGAGFDLAIALSILAADGQIDPEVAEKPLTYGELGLSGALCAVGGAVAISEFAAKTNRELILPESCASSAALVPDAKIRAARSLAEVVLFLQRRHEIPLFTEDSWSEFKTPASPALEDVVGQHAAKRALEISAAGAHNILLVGPPGTGKSMLAKRLTSLLPPITQSEALEIARIYSTLSPPLRANASQAQPLLTRPFRAPHHSTSTVGLIGGGSHLQVGDVSLAHRGVLFLDEFPEFRRDAIEALREPLETKEVVISRARFRANLPCDFILVAAMNPCPCGRRGVAPGSCRCPIGALDRYRSKISGPILDRVDLQIWVPPLSIAELHAPQKSQAETTAALDRIDKARRIQKNRTVGGVRLNNQLERNELNACCALPATAMALLESASTKFQLSARAYVRILRVARTIADLEEEPRVSAHHIAEALSYRGIFDDLHDRSRIINSKEQAVQSSNQT